MAKKIIQKTPLKKVKEIEKERKWYLVDATGQILGRLASKIATYLRGKNKPEFAPHLDVGDYVVVINAQKIKVTGKKMEEKIYYSHSGYPHGLKAIPFGKLLNKNPEAIIFYAVKGMLPKGRIGARIIKRLKIYRDEKHPHGVHQPEIIKFS